MGVKTRAPRKLVKGQLLTRTGSNALSRVKYDFERMLIQNVDEKSFQELEYENGKLTLFNREKGLCLLKGAKYLNHL